MDTDTHVHGGPRRTGSRSAVNGPAPAEGAARWLFPMFLLLVEYLALYFLVDLPTGNDERLASTIRLLAPIVLSAGASGWLLSREHGPAASGRAAALPPWRPWPVLVAQLAAFAATAATGWTLLRPGVARPSAAAFASWLALAALTALLAVRTAAPFRSVLKLAAARWTVPLVALALGIGAWRVAIAAESLWGGFATWTLRAVAVLLRITGGEVTLDESRAIVGLDDFRVLVAPRCSGTDGLGLVLIFQAVWLALARSRLRLRRALLLLPLGACAALGANVLRIAILMVVGARGAEDLAVEAFHSKLGWLMFTVIALGSVALAERVAWFRRTSDDAAENAGGVPSSAGAYLAPLLATMIAAVLTSMWREGVVDEWYFVRLAAAATVLLLVRRSLPAPSLSLSWMPILVAAAVAALWIPLSEGDGKPVLEALSGMSPAGRLSWISARVVGSCLVIPVVEELAFRGFLLRWIVSPDFEDLPARAWTWPAVILSSLAFGALHDAWLLGTAAGLAFAAARLWRGRLSDAIVAHALVNAAIAAAVLLGGRWDLWA